MSYLARTMRVDRALFAPSLISIGEVAKRRAHHGEENDDVLDYRFNGRSRIASRAAVVGARYSSACAGAQRRKGTLTFLETGVDVSVGDLASPDSIRAAIRPAGFMSNLLAWAHSIKTEGVVRSSTADGRRPFIHSELGGRN
jgi:hypothetical protein